MSKDIVSSVLALAWLVSGAPLAGADGPTTRLQYDENRNLIRQTDANGHVVAMGYDDLNRLRFIRQDPDGLNHVAEYQYDANGNEVLSKDPKGQAVESAYDALNRCTSKAYSFAPGDSSRPWKHTVRVEFGHDSNGNVTSITQRQERNGSPAETLVTGSTYDPLDRLETETITLPDGGGTRTVRYSYYSNGKRRSITDPSGSVTFFTYDGQDRLETVITEYGTANAKTIAYAYFPDGLLKEVRFPNGLTGSRTYDKVDRLLTITYARGAAVLSRYEYGYDANGDRASQIETVGGTAETTRFTYDALDRLRTISYSADTTFPNGRLVEYEYDDVGNRTREITKDPVTAAVLASKSGTFGATNWLLELRDDLDPTKTVTFAYDANGNQTSTSQNGLTTRFVYDVENRQTDVEQGESILGVYQYDAQGRLIKSIDDLGLRQYVYDESRRLVEYDDVGDPVAKYDYGDRLLRVTNLDGMRYYHPDALGTPTVFTDDRGAATAAFHLDPWGTFRSPAELDGARSRVGFTGYLFSRSIGLYYANARWYSPELGRFTTQDSVRGEPDDPFSLHRFAYGRANPLRFVDPTGHESFDQWLFGHGEDSFGKAFGKAVVYNTWNLVSFGTLARQDRLVEASEAGLLTEEQYDARTKWNAATATAQLGLTVATAGAGASAATASQAAVWGAAGGVAVQGAGDIGSVHGTRTKSIDDVGAADYGLAAGMGAVGGVGARQYALRQAAWEAPLSQRNGPVAIVEGESSIPPGSDRGGYHALDARPSGAVAREVEAPTTAAAITADSSRIQTTVGNLRRAGLKDAHHTIQDAAVRDLPGYSSELAPGIELPGPSTAAGTPHARATQVQKQRGGGTYAAERRIAYKALRRAGLSVDEARVELQRADDYFRAVGVTPTTPTRRPGNRR